MYILPYEQQAACSKTVELSAHVGFGMVIGDHTAEIKALVFDRTSQRLL